MPEVAAWDGVRGGDLQHVDGHLHAGVHVRRKWSVRGEQPVVVRAVSVQGRGQLLPELHGHPSVQRREHLRKRVVRAQGPGGNVLVGAGVCERPLC